MHCAIDQLCDTCVEESLAQLAVMIGTRGSAWADLVASHVVPEIDWPPYTEAIAASARRRVSDLALDHRLRDRLAVACARAARRRWDELRAAVAG